MIHPLIQDGDRPVRGGQVGDGILRENRDTVGGDHLRDSVVDLRIDVVGASRQNDSLDMVFLHEFKDFFALFADIYAGLLKLLPAGLAGGADLLSGDIGAELSLHSFRDGADAGKGHERIAEFHFAVRDLLHVIADVFRIGGDDRAVVVVVRRGKLCALIEEGRIENKIHPFFDQPHDVSVSDLGRIAGGLAGNRLYAHLVDPVCRERRENYAEAQLREENSPEGIVLVHVQDTGNTDSASGRLIRGKRMVAEDPAEFVFVEVGHVVLRGFFAQAPLTAVAGDEQALLSGLMLPEGFIGGAGCF